jgi:acyl-coenzyme A synthetase/AMP-(fatty) acid ligase
MMKQVTSAAKPLPHYWPDDILLSAEDVARIESVPLEERRLPVSTYEMLMDGCTIDPSKVAIEYFSDGARPRETGRQVTFAELRRKVNQVANLLHDLGVGKHDVVSVLMPAVPESQFLLWGAQAAGVVNPANWMLEPEILIHMFQSANTKVLAVYGGEELGALWPKIEIVARALPNLEAVLRVGGASPCPTEVAGVRVVEFVTAVEKYSGDALDSGRVFSGDDTASLFHTGGTTGAPKLARHLHRNQVFWVWASKYMLGFGSEELQMLGVPIFHVAGAVVGCYGPLVRGGAILLMTSAGYRHPSVLPNIWRLVDTYKANFLTVVPTLVNQVLSIPIGSADITSLRYVASSTAPLSTTVADAFHKMTGLRIRESWGMTETVAVTCITPSSGKVKVGSSGVRLPYTNVRVVHLDEGGRVVKDCALGESGSVIVRGPSVFPGYLGQDHGPRWIDREWLETGDLGLLDSERWMWITGRSKDLIIRGGHNIDPKMVEEALFALAGVQDAAVVGAPDAHSGEIPVAYVVLKPGANLSAEDVIAHANVHVPERAAVPKYCYVLAEMPKTLVGKIQKNVLRVDAIERMFRSALNMTQLDDVVVIKATDRGSQGFHVDVEVPPGFMSEMLVKEALGSFTIPYTIQNTGEKQACPE